MSTLVATHVLISLIGIVSGLVVSYAFLVGKRMDGWSRVFLISTFATSASGFILPADRLLPSHIFGIISLFVLAVAFATRNSERLVKAWSTTYIVSVLFAFYLNAFVLVVQLFQKVPALKALAPTQTEPAFALSHVALLVAFVVVGVLSNRRNHVLQVRAITQVLHAAVN